MKLLLLLGLSGLLLSCSPVSAQFVTNGQPIAIAKKVMQAAGYKQTGLDMAPSKTNEQLQCWSIGDGVLIIHYSTASEAITGLGFWLSDERPKAFRKTFDFEVVSFDTASGLMVIRTRKGEPDGAGNSHRAGRQHEHQTAQRCGCSRKCGCQWLCLTFSFGGIRVSLDTNILKNMNTKTTITTLAAVLITIAAQSQPTIFFGEDVSPYPDSGPNDVPRPTVLTNTFATAASFAAHLPGVIACNFEAYPTGSSPTNILFGTNVATLSGSRQILTVSHPADTMNGAFPILGTNALLLSDTQPGFFSLDFSSPQAAFGFFGTDFGELGGMRVGLIWINATRTDVDVPVTRPQGSAGAFFFGVISKNMPFVRVEFVRVGTADGFAFDDFTIATPGQIARSQLSIRVSEVELSWPTLTNETYSLQYQSAITGGVWSILQCVAGDGSIKRIYDKIAVGDPRRFYRLELTNCVPGL